MAKKSLKFGDHEEQYLMYFVIKKCQADLSELLTLLSPRTNPTQGTLQRGLQIFDRINHEALAHQEVAVLLQPARTGLTAAQQGSPQLQELVQTLTADGMPQPEEEAWKFLIDQASEAIRDCKVALSKLLRQHPSLWLTT